MLCLVFLVLVLGSRVWATPASRAIRSSPNIDHESAQLGLGYSAYWRGSFSFDNLHWPSMAVSRSRFVAANAVKMWANRPPGTQAAVCFSGQWRAKNYERISVAMSIAYFEKRWLGIYKRVHMYDCLYLWGPDQTWWSWDDADADKLAYVLGDVSCDFNATSSDIDCF